MPFAALLDASVLVPLPLADALLRIAAEELYDVLWSPDIVAEVERTLITQFHLARERVGRRIEHMRRAFPAAEVTGYADLIPTIRLEDPNDRHVVAAAIVGHAAVIVTNNIRHFSDESLEALGLEVQDPDTFLTHLYHLDPVVVRLAIQQQAAALRNPPASVAQVLEKLEGIAPGFVRLLRNDI